MARQFSMAAQIPPASLLPPAADAAGRTSAYLSLRNAMKAYIVARVNQGNAAEVTFTLLQAQNSAGLNSKAVSAMPIWLNDGTAASDALVAQTPGANFQTDATVADKIVLFEITPEAVLDVVNGFQHIALQTSASNGANITVGTLHILGAIQAATPPTSYV